MQAQALQVQYLLRSYSEQALHKDMCFLTAVYVNCGLRLLGQARHKSYISNNYFNNIISTLNPRFSRLCHVTTFWEPTVILFVLYLSF